MGENPLNRSGSRSQVDFDIVSTSSSLLLEELEKFIRELHGREIASTIHVKRMLGEMPPKQLAISTMLPESRRTLRQFTIEDCKEELNHITALQSDKTVFIKGVKISKEDIV